LLAQISAASVYGMVATRDRAGRRVRQRLADPEDDVRSGALCYASRGFSLHAATHIEATDRRRPERLSATSFGRPWSATGDSYVTSFFNSLSLIIC